MHHLKQRNVKIALIIFAIVFFLSSLFNSQLVAFIFHYLVLYRYITLFVVVFLAGLCVPIPMNILLLGTGALAAKGHFDFNLALFLTVVANVLGDVIAYLFFRKYARDILRDKFVEKYPFFLWLEEFFKAHTYISIFFGTPVNFLSGLTNVKPHIFVIFDFMGDLTFALIFLRLGYVVGDNWVTLSKSIGTIISAVSVIIVFIIVFLIFYKKNKSTQTL
jgi:membrane protein DedA with SNARE-associated domain